MYILYYYIYYIENNNNNNSWIIENNNNIKLKFEHTLHYFFLDFSLLLFKIIELCIKNTFTLQLQNCL